jgi:Ser/Thr protein kinase RdoA (MazF antagonist)
MVPTRDGARTTDGIVVHAWVDGHQPTSRAEWSEVRAALRVLHKALIDVPQRPGFGSALDLLQLDRAGDVDLTSMPADAVARCRRAWSRLEGFATSVVHGDPGASNIKVSGDGQVVFLDWDVCRVDVRHFDLAAVPSEVSGLAGDERWVAEQAASAWEAAVSWAAEPECARRRLAELSDS